jgi:uncharacterized membrane protein
MNKRVLAMALIAFLGMVDAFYLSIKRGSGHIPCHITHGCEEVLTSKYSEVAGVPLSWFGLGFYLAVFGCTVFELSGAAQAVRLVYWPAMAGFLLSVSLFSIQAFVLHAYCEYCLASAMLVTLIFILSFFERQATIARNREPELGELAKAADEELMRTDEN